MAKIIRWGIWGTGAIAEQLASDFPLTKGATLHAVSSRTLARAQAFAQRHGVPRAYEGLDVLLADPDVDVVYIATPNHCHADDSIACINAGKAVLCEKPFALNAAEAQRVIGAARQQHVFCMEAMWTRFIPAIVEARRMIEAGGIGKIRLLQGNFGVAMPPNLESRFLHHEQGGGALLDLGVYLISLAQHLLGPPLTATGVATLTAAGADEQSAYELAWADGALGDFASSLRVRSSNEFVVAGDRGLLRLCDPFYRPQRLVILPVSTPHPMAPNAEPYTPTGLRAVAPSLRNSKLVQRLRSKFGPFLSLLQRGKVHSLPFAGNGYQFQVDEVTRCLQQQQLESAIMPLDDSLAVMQTLDKLRSQWPGSELL